MPTSSFHIHLHTNAVDHSYIHSTHIHTYANTDALKFKKQFLKYVSVYPYINMIADFRFQISHRMELQILLAESLWAWVRKL